MKKQLFFICGMLLISITSIHAQDSSDTNLKQRETVYQNYISVKNQIVDTTLDNMKQLATAQADVISADNGIINDFLPSKLSKIKEGEKKLKDIQDEKEKTETDLKKKEAMFMYYYIGGGVLFLLFAAFLILWILQMGKTKKAKSKMKEVDKMKADFQKESATMKADIEKQKEIVKKETTTVKDGYDKEIAALKLKNTDMMMEKSKIENQLREKTLNESSFETKMNKLKIEYETKLHEASTNVNQDNELKVLQNDIELKTKQIEQLKGEKESDLQMLAELKELFEKEESQCKSLENEIILLKEQHETAVKDTECQSQESAPNPEFEDILAEKVRLENQIAELNTMLVQTKEQNAEFILKSHFFKPGYGRVPIIDSNRVSEHFIQILNQRLHDIKPDIYFGSLISEGVYFNGTWFCKNNEHDQDAKIILHNEEVDFALFAHANDDIEKYGILHRGNDMVILEEPTNTEEMSIREQMMFESIYVTVNGNQIKLFQYGEEKDMRYFDNPENKDWQMIHMLEPYLHELIYKYK